MNNYELEVWLRMYEEQTRHARHHETPRSYSTNIAIAISAAILAFLSSKYVSESQITIMGVFLVVVNAYGLIMSLKHYERSQLHFSVSVRYRNVISEHSSMNNYRLNEERRAGRENHSKKSPCLGSIRAHWLWCGLHGLIIAGAAIMLCME